MSDAAPRQLPRPIRARLQDIGRHYRALRANLDSISLEDYSRASVSSDERQLSRLVYPIERPFEIVDNYVVELAELALEELALGTGDARWNLRRLEEEGAISGERRRRLTEVHRIRNDAQHGYADVPARLLYEAAQQLVAEVPGLLRDYARWLRKHGYGKTA